MASFTVWAAMFPTGLEIMGRFSKGKSEEAEKTSASSEMPRMRLKVAKSKMVALWINTNLAREKSCCACETTDSGFTFKPSRSVHVNHPARSSESTYVRTRSISSSQLERA